MSSFAAMLEAARQVRVLFVLGPTGSGKSRVALELAQRVGEAEIVSADAYQVYRDLPILTAAPAAADLACVPHHLVHCLDLAENNDAARHARAAMACIEDIHSRGKLAIVTGGSGLYVKFISHGISQAPPADPDVRAELEAMDLDALRARFAELDPEGLALTPANNPRYLVRNLEIVICGAKPLSYWRENWKREPLGPGFVIERPVPELDARIYARASEMVEQGLLDEVAALEGRALSDTAQKTLGLALVQAHLAGEMPLLEMQASLGLMTRQYAKRQRTWLRREAWLRPM